MDTARSPQDRSAARGRGHRPACGAREAEHDRDGRGDDGAEVTGGVGGQVRALCERSKCEFVCESCVTARGGAP